MLLYLLYAVAGAPLGGVVFPMLIMLVTTGLCASSALFAGLGAFATCYFIYSKFTLGLQDRIILNLPLPRGVNIPRDLDEILVVGLFIGCGFGAGLGIYGLFALFGNVLTGSSGSC